MEYPKKKVKQLKSTKKIILFFILTTGLWGCMEKSLVNEIQPIEGDLWNAKDIKSFEFNVEDTITPYNFYLLIRNNEEYPYSNLYLFVNLELPGNRLMRDTVFCELANREGKWLGKGVGGSHNSEILYKYNQLFPSTGAFKITIEQAMREKDIIGITDVGISIRSNK